MSFLELEGKRVLVTGASSGIGRSVALELDQAGARLLLVGRDEGRLRGVLDQCQGRGHEFCVRDLAEGLEGISSWMKQASETGGPFAGAAHAAGIRSTKPLKMIRAADLEAIFRLNLHAGIMLAQGLRLSSVRHQPASFVFLSSVMGQAGAPGIAAYCGSKGGVEAVARSLALELASEKIRVNCVAPGFVDSEMLHALGKRIGQEQLDYIEAKHPLGFGQPSDVAKAVAFLLGDCSRWITGSVLVVDGGYLAQ